MSVQKWHWWTPLTDVDFYKDALDVRPEAKDLLIKGGDAIGQGVSNAVNPVAKSLLVPVVVVSLLAGVYFFRDEIKGLIHE